MNNALTADDLSDLAYLGSSTGGDAAQCARASQLDDHGAKLIGLGLAEVRREAVHGVVGSERIGITDAGLDELFERGL
jgi:hypothetical protein